MFAYQNINLVLQCVVFEFNKKMSVLLLRLLYKKKVNKMFGLGEGEGI